MTAADQRQAEIVTDGVILALWRQRMDTKDIAARLGMREADVYNRLGRAREAGR
jgi:DNA-directed RNA polymerase specialized sigma24 family protein